MSFSFVDPLLLLARQYPIELMVFLALLYITVYRREMSANQTYRKKKKVTAATTVLRVPTLSPEDLRSGMRIASMKVSDMSSRMRDIFNSNPYGYMDSAMDSAYLMLQQSMGTDNAVGAQKPAEISLQPHRCALERLLLNKDMMLTVFGYLEATDISSISTTCRGFLLQHDPEFVWQQLWMQRYGQQVWSTAVMIIVRQCRGIRWNPYANWGPPSQGWKLFFMEFEFAWIDWLLAGANTRSLCLLGYRGQVLNVTSFIDLHPGTGDTLLDHAGCECSAVIEEIGHSSFAHSLMKSFSLAASTNNVAGLDTSAGSSRINLTGSDVLSDSASEDEDALIDYTYTRTRSQLAVRLGLERAAALRVIEGHRVTMYPVPVVCGLKHKGKALGHIKPVFGAPDNADPDDPFLIIHGEAGESAQSPNISERPLSLVKMCPVAIGKGVSQDSFAPYLGPGGNTISDGAGNSGMWGVVLSVMATTANAPSASLGVAFAEWITVRDHGSGMSRIGHTVVSTTTADALLNGLAACQFSCCEFPSDAMWRRAADAVGSTLPNTEVAGEAAEYVFDAASIQPSTAQLFQNLPRAVPHVGQGKVFYDPLTQEWTAWWSCCGISYALDQDTINREFAGFSKSS